LSFVCRGARSTTLVFRQTGSSAFSTTRAVLSGSPEVAEVNGTEAKKDLKPSEVYQQRVEHGDLAADEHQQKVTAQVIRLLKFLLPRVSLKARRLH